MWKQFVSKDVREYIEKTDYQFSDMDIATIIYHSELSESEKLRLLSELGQKTEDTVLCQQIEERIAYARLCYQRFAENDGGCFYEARKWDAGDVIGHFATLDLALAHTKKLGVAFQINKYQIIGRCKKIITPQAKFNPRFASEWELPERPYQGEQISEYSYSAEGHLQRFWTAEMTREEEDAVDDWGEARFEQRFVAFPNPFEVGDIVRMADDCIGIVSTSQADWKEFLHRIEQHGLVVDYFDASLCVEYFSEDGEATHTHVQPIYLEKAEVDEETRKRLQSLIENRKEMGENGIQSPDFI